MLATIDPPGIEPDSREIYHLIAEAVTSLYGDATAAVISLAVISAGADHVIVRYTRGYDFAVRVALSAFCKRFIDSRFHRSYIRSGRSVRAWKSR